MLLGEICRESGLTRKAVEYYETQGLVKPRVKENGYRDYTEADLKLLLQIALFRELGLNVAEIKSILFGEKTLKAIVCKKEMEIGLAKEKLALLQKLSQAGSWDEVRQKARALDQKKTILQKLQSAFPGYYGQMISLHFAPFLGEPIQTQEQQEAYEQVVRFFDGMESFHLPPDLQEYLDEITKEMDRSVLQSSSDQLAAAVQNFDQYLDRNRESLEQYIAFKESEEYRSSPVFKLQEALKQFQKASGYNDVFLPAMKRLSSSYREYHKALTMANDKLLREYPSLEKWQE